MSILKDYIGLHVQLLKPVDHIGAHHLKGIIKWDEAYEDYYLVLDNPHPDAHACDGLTEDEYGWWLGQARLTPNDILILDGKSLPNKEEKISKKIKYLNERYNKHAESRNLPTKGILT